MWEGILGKLALAILGPAIGSALAGLGNTLLAPRQGGRDVNRQMRAMQEAAMPVPQTPAQAQADEMTTAANQARANTFAQLSQEYTTAQKAGPEAFWDPAEEARIRNEATTRAYGRYGGDAPPAQVQREVDRMMGEYRLGRSGAYETKLSNLRSQMAPYASVQQPAARQLPSAGQPIPVSGDRRAPLFPMPQFNIDVRPPAKPPVNPWMEWGNPAMTEEDRLRRSYAYSGPGG